MTEKVNLASSGKDYSRRDLQHMRLLINMVIKL